MEYIKNTEIEVLSNPGVESFQLLNPKNSDSTRVTITKVLVQQGAIQPRHVHETSEQIWIAAKGTGMLLLYENGIETERVFECGDVVRFADGDVHGLRNDGQEVFEYISVTSPPIDFGYAYKKSSKK